MAGSPSSATCPQGLPTFGIPDVGLTDLTALAAGAAGVALVAFADTSILSRTFSLRGRYEVDQNQELVALGVANGFTPVPGLPGEQQRVLPAATLAAVVIAGALSLVEIHGVARLARTRPSEFAVSLVAFVGVAVLGVLPGIGLAVGVALISFIRGA